MKTPVVFRNPTMQVACDNLTDRDFERVAEVVHAHCGINLHEGKRELVRARLAKLLRHAGAAGEGSANPSEYLDRVLQNPDSPAFIDFIDALSTNLTSFFREGEHFTFLADEFLPALFARKKSRGDVRLRGWCAASSTGEEPYSIAMTLRDAMERHPDGARLQPLLLATDICTRVLRVARAGLYDRRRADPVPQRLRDRYLQKAAAPAARRGFRASADDRLEPVPEIRQVVRFARLNLMEPWPFTGPLDFVFCRNVMIYFDKPTQQRLIGRLFDVLDSGGLLFTGHSESLTGISHGFRYVRPTIYAKP
jgi:chemotaxis protein methyltransferase CheR